MVRRVLVFCLSRGFILHGRVFLPSSRIPFSSCSCSAVVSLPFMMTKYSFSFSYLGWVISFMNSRSLVRTIRPSEFLSRRPIGFRPSFANLFGTRSIMVVSLCGSSRVVT